MHSPKKISKEKLIAMYSILKVQEICDRLKITRPTLNRLLKLAEIPLRGKGNKWPRNKYEVV